jgi:hypothetical protein
MHNSVQNFIAPEHSQKTSLQKEIENWEAQIDFIDKESSFYLRLISLPVLQFENSSFLTQALQEVKNANGELANILLQTKNSLEGLIECDDLQCETYYLDNQEEIHNKIKKHQSRFRAVKAKVFMEGESMLGLNNS